MSTYKNGIYQSNRFETGWACQKFKYEIKHIMCDIIKSNLNIDCTIYLTHSCEDTYIMSLYHVGGNSILVNNLIDLIEKRFGIDKQYIKETRFSKLKYKGIPQEKFDSIWALSKLQKTSN